MLFPDGRTRALDLGPAAPMDQAASHLRDSLARRDASFQAFAQTLYPRVFRPLLPLLGEARRLFLSPDGQLALIPFAALHDGRRSGSSASPEAALVTALELAGLNLWGTQLVVLSACDTGRGEIKLGQGVYGLRRALITAGAETVVMSLWKVNDETTRTLMEAYYRHLLAGEGRASALREAMRSLRQTQPHPHYWAPFIVLGLDGPLRGAKIF